METQHPHLEQAMRDLALIRRTLDRAEKTTLTSLTLKVDRIVQGTAFVLAFALLIIEVISGGINTEALLVSRDDAYFLVSGIIWLGALLVILSYALYAVVRFAAHENEKEFKSFVTEHFVYLHRLSIFSDLFIKFLMVALIAFAGKPEWVAPLLLFFTGDYLLQGRFFSLTVRVAAPLGGFCILAGVAQLWIGSPALWFPFLVFSAIALLSFIHVMRIKPSEGQE